jgi:hypothetical protein
MKAKLVNEKRMGHNPDIENKAFEIAQVVESTYNGDDVDYEANDEDIETLESVIKDTVKKGYLYLQEEDQDLEIFADSKWILDNVPAEEILLIYDALVDAGFISGNESNDRFDLDQDIYDRNPDYDVDESVNEDLTTGEMCRCGRGEILQGYDVCWDCLNGVDDENEDDENEDDESLNEKKSQKNKIIDYGELAWKMDKFMPEDEDIQNEFWELLASDTPRHKKILQVAEFIADYCNDAIDHYMPKGGSFEGLAEYLVDNN